MRWTWEKDDLVVRNGQTAPTKYKLGKYTKQEVEEFMARVAKCQQIYTVLFEARASFSEGRAMYENCIENLERLLESLEVAQLAVMSAAKEVSAFFEPGGLEKSFKSEKQLRDFLVDTAPRILEKANG